MVILPQSYNKFLTLQNFAKIFLIFLQISQKDFKRADFFKYQLFFRTFAP